MGGGENAQLAILSQRESCNAITPRRFSFRFPIAKLTEQRIITDIEHENRVHDGHAKTGSGTMLFSMSQRVYLFRTEIISPANF